MDRLTAASREIFRFVSEDVRTNMYVLLEETRALVVDPHPSAEVLALLQGSGVAECTVLLTHEHPDHISGLYTLQELRKTRWKTKIICQEACGRAIASRDNCHPALVVAMLAIQDSRNGTDTAEHFRQNYEPRTYVADVTFGERLELDFGREHFTLVSTPGHTPGSACILWNHAAVFTGDSLLRDMPVITRLPGGSTKRYREVTLPFLQSLDRNLLVLPGHGPEFRMADVCHGDAHVEPA